LPLDTYANLKAAIPAWAMRTGDTEFAAQVPDFITLAEARLNNDLRVGAQEKTALILLTDGVASLPDDYLEARLFRSTTYPYGEIEFLTPGQAAAVYVSEAAGSPSPSIVSLTYYAKIPALSDASPTNWLLARYPNAYLYASLIEAAPYMEEDARAQTWLTFYQAAVQGIRNDDIGARYPTGRARVRGATP
jgi:hypothetical protein